MNTHHYILLSMLLFTVGSTGFLIRRNVLIVLMSIELMLNASSVAFVAFNCAYPHNQTGQVFSFFVIAIAAAEASVGLALLLSFYRLNRSTDTNEANLLKN
ncbi:NADH-quinone oxidoreductase subunit NuoK [Pajaroellobacter abortibovis]|uniref:NADH-quinone oxidoreductase subunit K n=1 Tax=Pajaroellobacter abortibovis TaxID=1882918 RepID=A0A1L6MXK7_9BACT|nr:NADH-quinone oxidoreductase subunit NuoK [Pajaroellobacter abortibovis]APS00206.1 NADH-quinone oxidoreductase subunit K [Pajaroellobacter abortibovis]